MPKILTAYKKKLELELDCLTQKALADDLFAGSLIRIEQDGQLLLEKAWGFALLSRQTGEQQLLTPEHLFDIASLSKLFTGTAILRLITMGALGEHTPVLDILDFKDSFLQTSFSDLCISQLLDHSSGIHDWYPFYTRKDESVETILSSIMKEYPRKNQTIYSDLNFMLLGLVIEKLTKKNLVLAMQDLVFDPLQLKSACYNPKNTLVVATEFGNRIEKTMLADRRLNFDGWRSDDKPQCGECNDGNCFYYFGGIAGHAGIFAQAADVAKLAQVYMPSAKDSTEYLDPSLCSRATTNRGNDRGYAFQFGQFYPFNGFGHTGFTGTYLHINPAHHISISVLTNRLHVASPQNITSYRIAVSQSVLQNSMQRTK